MGEVIQSVTERRRIAAETDSERLKENDRLNQLYAELVASDLGREIMRDLQARFGSSRRRFMRGPNGATDPWSAAVRDGESAVIHYIETRAEKGDDREEK